MCSFGAAIFKREKAASCPMRFYILPVIDLSWHERLFRTAKVELFNSRRIQTMDHEYIENYFQQVKTIVDSINEDKIEKIIDILLSVRESGKRLFFIGVGGSAGSASHAVNDFRKICGFEAYAPTDNVSELTARVNDDGWESVFSSWLKVSRIRKGDAVFVFSVGGGSEGKKISVNIVEALKLAREVGAYILGVVGRDGGYTAQVADACIVIPTLAPDTVTPLVESFHGVIWHLLVSHPRLKKNDAKWESMK
ncbi:MAG: SIS domain-containing protein [Synergistaceae bacterium]|jgi:D-sedoheptulose 7-phosphate isomerase|nr:SIS domain-containing protein [Synergistaceae bacterium]